MKDYQYVRERLLAFARKHAHRKIVWITGRATNGPDDMVYHFAKWDVPGEIIEMPADWDEYGKSAGYIRNAKMAEIGDELLLFWDGKSNGSRHMHETMREHGKPVTTFIVDVESPIGDCEFIDFTPPAMAA